MTLALNTKSVPTVCVIDADAAVRDGIRMLLDPLDVAVCEFASAEAFLSATIDVDRCCLIAEASLPGLGGLELLDTLRRRGQQVPVIILISNPSAPQALRAMRAGAVDVLDKPFIDQTLLQRVSESLLLSDPFSPPG